MEIDDSSVVALSEEFAVVVAVEVGPVLCVSLVVRSSTVVTSEVVSTSIRASGVDVTTSFTLVSSLFFVDKGVKPGFELLSPLREGAEERWSVGLWT